MTDKLNLETVNFSESISEDELVNLKEDVASALKDNEFDKLR